MKYLSDILPIYGVEQDMILSKMGDITLGYRLTLPEIFTLSSTDFENLHQSWLRAIRLLPAGTVLHKQDWFLADRFGGDFQQEHDFLSHASERFFHERAFLAHESYLLLTLAPAGRQKVNSYFSSLLRKHFPPMETLDPAFVHRFQDHCSQFIQVLCDGGLVDCQRMSGEELEALVREYLILGKDAVHRDLDFSDGIKVGEKDCSLFTLASLENFPTHCGAKIRYDRYASETSGFPIGFTTAIGQLLPCNHIYNQYLFIEDATSVAKEQEKRRLRFQSLSLYARENLLAKEATDQFLQELAGSQAQPVRAHFNVLAWTDEKAGVQELRNQCSAAFAAINAIPHIETVGAPQIFWAGIPGNAADLPVNETVLVFAHQAACFLHQETQYKSSTSCFGIRLGDRISGRPLHVDLSDEPMAHGITSNRNKFILGPSGSGKSFFTNHLLRAYYYQGAHIVLVDVGHSYQGLCELVGGIYFSYSDTQRICFNPFQGIMDSEKKESIKALLVTLWKKEGEAFSRSEYVALSNALQLYYEKGVAVYCFDSFYEFLRVDFAAKVREDGVKPSDFDLQNLLYVLRPFHKGGEYDYLLNASTDLDLLQARFIVFELDTIKDHPILFPVVTIIIMELFVSKIRRLKGVRKVILIEEAWKAIAKAGMAEYIRYLYKTIRKHFGEPIIVTQELDDILSSAIVKQTIIAMSDCKILFDQSKYEQQFETVQELLGLSEKEKALVLSLNRDNEVGKKYKEVFISLGGRVSKVYRVEVSKEEYLAYTTEEKEKLLVMQALEKTGSMEAAIKKLIHENL
ncbi:TraG family conjugative transposon ATPase [Sediminibacterium sp.]|uniref:TraG family conjugative transposon ATPase n=1 Tax=Sediminibacterium sp. TaxID=1917865 RepID=UPI003F695A00